MKTFTLDLEKALKEGYVIDRAAFFEKYSKEKNGYIMLKGTPLVRNIEGHIVLEADIPELIPQKLRFFHNNLVTRGTTIFYRWKK